MFDRAYMDIQKVLDEELGTEEDDGAGEGIVADILLALDKRERRGAVKAVTSAAEITRRSASQLAAATGTPLVEGVALGLATSLHEYASQIESGEATL